MQLPHRTRGRRACSLASPPAPETGLCKCLALLLLVAALVPLAAQAHSHRKRSLEIVHPWTAAMVEERVVNVAVYMKLRNEGRVAERLLGLPKG